MANATKNTVVVTPAVAAVTEEKVILELTQDEAEALTRLVGSSSGFPTGEIYGALSDAGYWGMGYRLKVSEYGVPVITREK